MGHFHFNHSMIGSVINLPVKTMHAAEASLEKPVADRPWFPSSSKACRNVRLASNVFESSR